MSVHNKIIYGDGFEMSQNIRNVFNKLVNFDQSILHFLTDISLFELFLFIVYTNTAQKK